MLIFELHCAVLTRITQAYNYFSSSGSIVEEICFILTSPNIDEVGPWDPCRTHHLQ